MYKHDDTYRRGYEREERKRPRTPPIQSPKRPHTPHSDHKETVAPPEVQRFPEEDDKSTEKVCFDRKKYIVNNFLLQKSGPKKDKENREPSKSPVKEVQTAPVVVEEGPSQIDAEEFEPILSDEEIVDEELDYDYSAFTNIDDLIKLFVPGVTGMRRHGKPAVFTVSEEVVEVEENLKTTIGILDDYFKSSITKYVLEVFLFDVFFFFCKRNLPKINIFQFQDFDKLNIEIKEEFVHLCEKLINAFGSTENFCHITKIYTEITHLKNPRFNPQSQELADQVKSAIVTLIDWLKIAVSYEMANLQEQPLYKIRHIKCGVRISEYCCHSPDFINLLWSSNFNIHEALLSLFDREFMALSIKLMIIKVLDTYLLHKSAIEKFLRDDTNSVGRQNGYHTISDFPNGGYKILVEKMLENPSVRLKFALNSVLKKLNLFEILDRMHSVLVKSRGGALCDEELAIIEQALEHVLSVSQNGQFGFSQPRRFLPVSAQFEINRSDSRDVLVEFFRMFDLVQCFFLLLTNPSCLNRPTIKTPIFDILAQLLKTNEGLQYLADNLETLNPLLRCLLRHEDDIQYLDYIDIKSHNLGLELAYKMEALFHIEALEQLKNDSNDPDNGKVLDQLHGLFCLTFTNIGRISCCEVLALGENVKSLLNFLDDIFIKDKSENLINNIKKSPGIAYIIDLIAFTVMTVPNVPFLEAYYKFFRQISEQNDIFEDATAVKLIEMKSYLSPLENGTLNYDNISHFVEIINKNLNNIHNFPETVITSLRIIEYLGVSPYSGNSPVLPDNPLNNYVELKYKHVILQLFSLDGSAILVKLLQKINEFFEQPTLHVTTFASSQGFLITNTIKPCVSLLKHMLTYVIQCRNTNFKDLTAVPVLLQTHNLLNSFSPSTGAYLQAQEICKNIVDTLLVYTQPVSDEIHEKDSLSKTLWTQMCGEVIKFVMSAPYRFISGLLVLSELLPLPLPVQTKQNMGKDEAAWVVNLRKLWSAHLHPHSNLIQDLINKLCTTSHQPLLNLLRRVCVQIADLAANSALMIAKGVLDSVIRVLGEVGKTGICNNHLARLLNFLACLVTHGTVKCAVLHLLHSSNHQKIDEKYPSLVTLFTNVLTISNSSTSHIQAQECILSIIQSFCDIEITLLTVDSKNDSSDLYLSNALPLKEQLLAFMSMVLDYLQVDNSFVTYLPCLRTLILLTEHDYGFYHLRELLNKKTGIFLTVLNKLVKSFSKENAECLSTLNTLMEFVRVCSAIEDVDAALLYTPRRNKMGLGEIKGMIGWKSEGGNEEHPLLQLEEILKKLRDEDLTFESLLEGVSVVVKLIHSDPPKVKELLEEPSLPEPETLLVQFSSRLIFTSSDVCDDDRLSIRYWLSIPSDEIETENVSCDLNEIARQYLPPDFNLAREIEKLCRVCPIDSNDEKEKHDSDLKAKMKKPFGE